jgi:hypothetical protein
VGEAIEQRAGERLGGEHGGPLARRVALPRACSSPSREFGRGSTIPGSYWVRSRRQRPVRSLPPSSARSLWRSGHRGGSNFGRLRAEYGHGRLWRSRDGLVYQVFYFTARATGKSAPSWKTARTFERAGAAGRLKGIAEAFAIRSKHFSYIDTLNGLHNCLTHRHGVVSERDCNDVDSKCLRVKYLRFQPEVQPPVGEVTIISPERVEPLRVKEGEHLQARMIDTERAFPLGSVVPSRIQTSEMYCSPSGMQILSSGRSF